MKMDYLPERDIPRIVKEIKSLSPTKIVEWIRDHRTEKDALGKKHQLDITPQSVTMWFKRHPDIYQTLARDLESDLITPQAISEDLFRNGAFSKVPCVETWQFKMRARQASEGAIDNFTRILKSICLGQLPRKRKDVLAKVTPTVIEGWGMKHPARLTVEDCLRYNSELTKTGAKGRNFRLTMRNFLKSRNLEGWDSITGALESTAGQYAHLYAPPEKIREIFAWLKRVNAEAHDASYFAFKTACRIHGTLEAESKYVDKEQETIFVFEKASLHTGKRKLEKLLPTDLYELIKPRIERGGKLFNISEPEINGLLRACYKEVIPELEKEIPMPFHFWRHQFAQHMLRATGWNYGLVARLGHWTVETLERYYGKMDRQTALESGRKILPQICQVSEPALMVVALPPLSP